MVCNMFIKTSELIGPALDWAVAKCEGKELNWGKSSLIPYDYFMGHLYSANWAQGGLIIARECIWLRGPHDATKPNGATVLHIDFWYAHINHKYVQSGPTPLIAAMRCYVASKLGDEVEVPEELK